MKHEAIATGKTVEDAIAAGCRILGVDRARIETEVLELPSKRLLGLLGASDAKVKVIYEETVEDRAKGYLSEILMKMGFDSAVASIEDTEGGLQIQISGEGLGVIIGHRGETLDALQYLITLAANRGSEEYKRITLDIGGYREKREKTLVALAKRIAQSTIKTRRSTTLEPMSAYERRIIHTAVQEIRGVSSWSVGEEPNRKVVIGAENQGQRYGYHKNNR